MRDRLIELLDEAEIKVGKTLDDKISLGREEWLGTYADHLLANGVIVPPCEVYKDVYLIVNGIIERCTVEGIHYTRRKNYVRLRPYHQEYWGNWSKYYTPSLRSFGKTVFLTREEAEQALKDGEQE